MKLEKKLMGFVESKEQSAYDVLGVVFDRPALLPLKVLEKATVCKSPDIKIPT